jgi:hypothetical protein
VLVNSKSISELNSTGKPVQKFTRLIEHAATKNTEELDKIVGIELVDGSLFVNLITYYDGPGDNKRTTMVVEDANALATSDVSAFHCMEGRARAAGWISTVPEEWRELLKASHISGNSSGDPIISRLSVGPSAFALNLTNGLNSSVSKSIDTKELQGFSLSRPLNDDYFNDKPSNTLWNHMSQARYGFIVPGTSTYLTLGISGGHKTGVGYKNLLEDGSRCFGYCPIASSDMHNYYWLWDMNDWLRVKAGDLEPEDITPELIGEHVSISDLPPPDLCIRTGGDARISNFMLWHFAYSELYFTNTLWPDFGELEFSRALADYSRRERRFGVRV